VIDGVITKKLSKIADERGYLMEMIRRDDEVFTAGKEFGQVYLTTALPGVVKGWHYHNHQDDNFCIIKGMAKVVLYDGRQTSKTKSEVNEFFIGEQNPMIIHIPVGVFHGFKCYGTEPCILINLITNVYNREAPDECRVAFDDPLIPYNWHKEISK